MAILGLQGVRGGVGTTSVTAALAWSLQLLGESVLVIDACADNLLRMSFNVDFSREEGCQRKAEVSPSVRNRDVMLWFRECV